MHSADWSILDQKEAMKFCKNNMFDKYINTALCNGTVCLDNNLTSDDDCCAKIMQDNIECSIGIAFAIYGCGSLMFPLLLWLNRTCCMWKRAPTVVAVLFFLMWLTAMSCGNLFRKLVFERHERLAWCGPVTETIYALGLMYTYVYLPLFRTEVIVVLVWLLRVFPLLVSCWLGISLITYIQTKQKNFDEKLLALRLLPHELKQCGFNSPERDRQRLRLLSNKQPGFLLPLVSSKGSSAWLDSCGTYLHSIAITHGRELKKFVTLPEFRSLLGDMGERLDKWTKSNFRSRRLFHALCQNPPGNHGDYGEEVLRWGEERLHQRTFEAWFDMNPATIRTTNLSKSVTGMTTSCGLVNELEKHDVEDLWRAMQDESMEEMSTADEAWSLLLNGTSVSGIVKKWQEYTPACGNNIYQLTLEFYDLSKDVLQDTVLCVKLRLRHLSREVGYLHCCINLCKEGQWTIPIPFRTRCVTCSNIELKGSNPKDFDEYSIEFNFVPDPDDSISDFEKLDLTATHEPLQVAWQQELRHTLLQTRVGWSISVKPEPEQEKPNPLEDPSSHPMSAENASDDDMLWLRFYLPECEPRAKASISSTKWWPLSPYKHIIEHLCVKYQAMPAQGIVSVDIMDPLKTFVDKETTKEMLFEKEVRVTFAASHLLEHDEVQSKRRLPPFLLYFERETWKATRAMEAATHAEGGEKSKHMPGWFLERMQTEDRLPWHAGDGSDPIRWLEDVNWHAKRFQSNGTIELVGKRRIFLDVYGDVHLLWPSHCQLLNGTEAADAEECRMSRMAINDMLRTLQQKHQQMASNKQIQKEGIEFTIELNTRADVRILGNAISPQTKPAVRELSTGQALLQGGGVRLLLLESPALAATITDISDFEKALDGPNKNSALLPASARLSVPFQRLRQVPNTVDQLPLQLLAVARLHGFEPTRLDACEALRVLSMRRHGSKIQAQVNSLHGLLNGEPSIELCCPHSEEASEYMTLKKPTWFKWNFECAVCLESLASKNYRFWCKKCNVYICYDCSVSIGELKDELRILKKNVDDLDSDDEGDWEQEDLQNTLNNIYDHKSLQMVKQDSEQLVKDIQEKGKAEFETTLMHVVPIQRTCSKCEAPLRRCTHLDRLKSPSLQCQSQSCSSCTGSSYFCNKCKTRACRNCVDSEVGLRLV